MLNLNQLAQFLEIARSSSLSAAARELRVSAPALSKSLSALERQLGGRLFDRVGRGLRLTVFGAELAREAEKLLGHAEQVARWAGKVVSGETGSIRVGCGPLALQGPISRVLLPALADQNGISLDIVAAQTSDLLSGLDDHKFDFLVTDSGELPISASSGHYQLTTLPQESVILVCSTLNPLSAQCNVSLSAALEYPWVSPQIPYHYQSAMAQLLQQENASPQAFMRLQALPDIRVENMSACLQIAAASQCIAGTLKSVADGNQLPASLQPLDIELNLTTRISIIQIRNRTVTPAATRLIELMLAPHSAGVNQIGAV